jgi:phosphoribosylformimino-5-aminoimidazole carboxamide ribotide isomerase
MMNTPPETEQKLRGASAIIPVIDLMIGQVVLARDGNRERYQPIHTRLTRESDPVTVARALFGQTGCDCLYVADLDSFEGAKPGWNIYDRLLDVGFQIWVDADWLSQYDRLDVFKDESQAKSIRPIISTEQISDENQFEQLEKLCREKINPLFSVDLCDGELLSRCKQLRNRCPRDIVRQAYQCGARSLIWLDVAAVGTHRGVKQSLATIKEIQAEFPDLAIISGGGVRNPGDASLLLAAGCQHVLVASAIHDCKFRPDDITRLDSYRGNSRSMDSV